MRSQGDTVSVVTCRSPGKNPLIDVRLVNPAGTIVTLPDPLVYVDTRQHRGDERDTRARANCYR